MILREESFERFIFLRNTKPFLFGKLKICIGGGFLGIYMNSSNLIYIIIVFLKLKIY